MCLFHRLHAIVNIQLGEDVPDMMFDGIQSNSQFTGQSAGRIGLCQQLENLPFALTERMMQ